MECAAQGLMKKDGEWGFHAYKGFLALKDVELKEQYKDIPPELFQILQQWHDDDRNFDENGISKRGEFVIGKIKEGIYDNMEIIHLWDDYLATTSN